MNVKNVEKLFCITDFYPDLEGWSVIEEFFDFEKAKETLKEYSIGSDYFLAECYKEPLSNFLPNVDSLIEKMEESIYNETGIEDCFKDEKECVKLAIEKMLKEISNFNSIKSFVYEPVRVKKENKEKEVRLKVWKWNEEKNDLEEV